MTPRTGRPTDNPKRHETRIRMSDKDIEMLNYCCEVTGKTKADIFVLESGTSIMNLKRNRSNRPPTKATGYS